MTIFLFNRLVIMRKMYNVHVNSYDEVHYKLANKITCLNLKCAGRTVLVSRDLWRMIVDHDFVDDICFHPVVCYSNKFNPLKPVVL